MAILPVPERGQPLDVTYIYQIVKTVNDISNQLGTTSQYKFLTVDTPKDGKQSTRATEARIIGGYVQVGGGSSQIAGSTQPFTYSFTNEFKFAPVVTATPVNTGNTDAGKDVSVSILSISPSKVEGTVKFNVGGDVAIGLNLIIVGIPN
jgi:hypothetical protein